MSIAMLDTAANDGSMMTLVITMVLTVGRVVAIKDDTFVLETGSDRMKIRFRRSAIASVEKLDLEAK